MTRGEVWTAAGGGAPDCSGKPRPVVIIQDDRFDGTDSMLVCPFTTYPVDAPLFRLVVEPDTVNGLSLRSWLMVDKIAPVRRSRLDERVGRLNDDDMVRLGRAVLVFLGVAGG